MLLAFYCSTCNLIWYLKETVIHELNDQHFSGALYSRAVHCPCCRQYASVRRLGEQADIDLEETQ